MNKFLRMPVLFCCIVIVGTTVPAFAQIESVQFVNGTTELAASFMRPPGNSMVPAVVIVHGSGASSRKNAWTDAYAKALRDRGIAVLYPDKRGSGASKGSWQSSSFEDLAGDASAGIRFLRSLPNIDTARIGVIAFSQGGYVASILAVREPMCKFTIVVSGGTATLLEQTVNELELEAKKGGVTIDASMSSALRSVYKKAYGFATTGNGWDALQDTLSVIQKTNPVLAQGLRTMPRDSTIWVWNWIRAVGDFDPIPYWEQNRKPALLIYGGKDTQVMTAGSIQRITQLSPAAMSNISVHYFGGNGHTLYRDDCLDFIKRWIEDKGVN